MPIAIAHLMIWKVARSRRSCNDKKTPVSLAMGFADVSALPDRPLARRDPLGR
jgi:hypothetical protein